MTTRCERSGLTKHFLRAATAMGVVAAAGVVLAQAGGQPPRGASGPPEHAKVVPGQQPAESVRDGAQLRHAPRRAPVGLGQRDPGRRRRQARLGRRPLRHQFLRRIDGESDRQARSLRQGRGPVRRRADPVAARHGRRQAGQRLGRRRARGQRRGAEEVPRRQGQGQCRAEVQPAGQAAADARHSGRRPAIRRRGSPSRTTSSSPPTAASSWPRRTTRSSSTRTARAPSAASRSSPPTASSSRASAPSASAPSEFRGPHSLAFDSKGRLFVADRGNRRIQIFDQDGKHLDTWYQFSRISGLTITADDTLYAIDSESDDNYNPGWRKGLRVGSARTGEVWYFVPEHVSKQASGMGGYGSMGEGVTVDGAGNVYAGEVGPIQGLTKYVPRLKR